MFVGLVGAALLILGGSFHYQSIQLTDSAGSVVDCGSAASRNPLLVSEQYKRGLDAQTDRMLGRPDTMVPLPDCESARSARKLVTSPLMLVGVLTIVGAAFVGKKWRHRDRRTAAN